MKCFRVTCLLAAISALSTLAGALNPIVVKGSQFVDSKSGKRLMIVGVDYQPGGQSGYKPEEGKDPLSDPKICLRDAAVMQSLGVNTIRVYNLDPTINHDECASIFNYAGIYMILDVNSPLPHQSLHRLEPESSYHAEYLKRIFSVVEAFKNYPNTLGFFAANEVINDVPTAESTPPYIRAIIRDLRAYIKAHADRPIPVGYSAADVREVLKDTWEYMQCSIEGEADDMSRSDFFGLNSYSWCGGSATYSTSGYDKLVEMFKSTSIPIFFSEYGCNEVQPRVFSEVQSIYGKDMTVLSGGLVYEYTQEEADYGLVQVNGNQTLSLRQDYVNLQSQYNKLDIGLLQSSDGSSKSVKFPKCSKDLISSSSFNSSFSLPRTPSDASDMIKSRVKDAPAGKLVEVKNTKSPYEVYSTDGSVVPNLEIKRIGDGQSNVPSGSNLNSHSGGNKPGAAGNFTPKLPLLLGSAVFALLMCVVV